MPLLNEADKVYVGNLADAIYMGADKIWPSGAPAGPFLPTDLPGLATWLDAVDYTSGSWPNRGGGPAVTLPGTPAPTVSINTLNGKPLVRFKGNEGKVRSTWPYPSNDWTLVYWVRWVGPNPGRAFSVQYPPSNVLVGMHTSQPDTMYSNGTWLVKGTGWNGWTTGTTNPWRMYGSDSSQSEGGRFFIDGTQVGSAIIKVGPQEGFYGGWGLSGYGPGVEETLDIEVAELVLYNRKLSDAERQQVEGYLNKKWLSPWDADTQAYLDATGLDISYAPALDGLVLGLKDKGLWSKMHAIYPFIGGTADLHKWNLKYPIDSDAYGRLTFTGGAHTNNLGYRPNPEARVANGNYADTHIVPRGIFDQDSTHLAYYSLLDVPPRSRCEMGCYNWDGNTANRFHIIARYNPGDFYYGMAEAGITGVPVPASSGLFIATRTAANYQAGYRNGVLVGNSSLPSIWLPNVSIWIGGINTFQDRSDLPCGFASVGTGLTPQNVTDLYEIVQAYQTALGRQVAP